MAQHVCACAKWPPSHAAYWYVATTLLLSYFSEKALLGTLVNSPLSEPDVMTVSVEPGFGGAWG